MPEIASLMARVGLDTSDAEGGGKIGAAGGAAAEQVARVAKVGVVGNLHDHTPISPAPEPKCARIWPDVADGYRTWVEPFARIGPCNRGGKRSG